MEQNNLENSGEVQETKKGLTNQRRLLIVVASGFVLAIILGVLYYFQMQKYIYVEKCQILAPAIDLSSQNGGSLQKLFVEEGDLISQNSNIAQVGNEIITAKSSGTVTSVQKEIGKNFSPGEAVATMIRQDDLRVVARVEEDKGLDQVKLGQPVFFTVDTFGSKEYSGIVDEINKTARTSDIVFNISSQRQLQEFEVKIRFDRGKYPELLNGMSAKSWIYRD
jgi:multidrug resistance efflux pump